MPKWIHSFLFFPPNMDSLPMTTLLLPSVTHECQWQVGEPEVEGQGQERGRTQEELMRSLEARDTTGALDHTLGSPSSAMLRGWAHSAQGSSEVAVACAGSRSQAPWPDTPVGILTLQLLVCDFGRLFGINRLQFPHLSCVNSACEIMHILQPHTCQCPWPVVYFLTLLSRFQETGGRSKDWAP